MGPFVLLPTVQMGQVSPWFQAVLPSGPSKSPVISSLPESCSLTLLEGAQLRRSPMLGERAGSNPGSRSEARGRAEATCVVCHICKESTAGVSAASFGGDSRTRRLTALPQVAPSLCSASLATSWQPLHGEQKQ